MQLCVWGHVIPVCTVILQWAICPSVWSGDATSEDHAAVTAPQIRAQHVIREEDGGGGDNNRLMTRLQKGSYHQMSSSSFSLCPTSFVWLCPQNEIVKSQHYPKWNIFFSFFVGLHQIYYYKQRTLTVQSLCQLADCTVHHSQHLAEPHSAIQFQCVLFIISLHSKKPETLMELQLNIDWNTVMTSLLSQSCFHHLF